MRGQGLPDKRNGSKSFRLPDYFASKVQIVVIGHWMRETFEGGEKIGGGGDERRVGRYFQSVGHKTDGFPVLVMENVPFAVFAFRWRMNLRELRHVADAAARVVRMFAFPLRIGNDKPRTGSVGFHWFRR